VTVLSAKTTARAIGLLIAAALLAVLVACGEDDEADRPGNRVEKSFLTGMVAHHESALEMAAIAKTRGKDLFVKDLAGDILLTQRREIDEMERIYERLFDGKLTPDPSGHDGLGLSAEDAGMTHTSAMNDELRSAEPFDRAFVDEMVPHHEGALKMSRAVLRRTDDGALRRLADGIVSAQEREIEAMNDFRTETYGGPVPERRGHGKAHGAHHSG
jgi:uncharacterized protein (DUF305 family)